METMERFKRYAAAFEETYEDDDWSRLDEFFAEEAEYHVLGMPFFPIAARGRAEVFASLKGAVNVFDRRFDRRKVELAGQPEVGADRFFFPWVGVYEVGEAPMLTIEGTEEILYDGEGRIVKLTDAYASDMADKIQGWLEAHGPALRPARGQEGK